ncbi:cytidylate kinase [Rhizopus microsporus ATCC 52813]|uniref:(d)CMP kinase n=1 Tax=Rhizopus microsporus ATCC 52813 TaxID=1340429 RepID=A0A2G4SF06_RHIZD|nr:cytidylate kinase [Rhizopus microsporus ATCC 52813]PHZ07360.1 cytidylate kinase [Rhizopus microsporus ATCC 52813]
MPRLFRIAIDGPAASGKSTTAKLLASRLGFTYIDSGAMFRAITLKCQQNNINPTDPLNQDQVAQIAKNSHICFPSLGQIELDGHNVSHLIRTSNITRNINLVAANPQVRSALAEYQRAIASQRIKGVVMDGRDIGTVILPDAELKVFIEADVWVRAQRRFEELKNRQGNSLKETLDDVKLDLEARDLADRTRNISPLKKAGDALVLDTSSLSIEKQVGIIQNWVYQRISQ